MKRTPRRHLGDALRQHDEATLARLKNILIIELPAVDSRLEEVSKDKCEDAATLNEDLATIRELVAHHTELEREALGLFDALPVDTAEKTLGEFPQALREKAKTILTSHLLLMDPQIKRNPTQYRFLREMDFYVSSGQRDRDRDRERAIMIAIYVVVLVFAVTVAGLC